MAFVDFVVAGLTGVVGTETFDTSTSFFTLVVCSIISDFTFGAGFTVFAVVFVFAMETGFTGFIATGFETGFVTFLPDVGLSVTGFLISILRICSGRCIATGEGGIGAGLTTSALINFFASSSKFTGA